MSAANRDIDLIDEHGSRFSGFLLPGFGFVQIGGREQFTRQFRPGGKGREPGKSIQNFIQFENLYRFVIHTGVYFRLNTSRNYIKREIVRQ